MLDLDGGDGGGQLVRSALSCSLLTGDGFELTDVRGDRSTPGLRPQHVAAVELATAISDATVAGGEEGSQTLRFDPGEVTPGDYEVDVGTAGSLTLLCDVALPLATQLDAPLRLTVGGGTDVNWSPPVDYLVRVKLPLLRRFGVGATLDVDRRGFYPVGGGRATLSLFPSSPKPVRLEERGSPDAVRIYATASDGLAEASVAERLGETAASELREEEWTVVQRTVDYVASDTPGAVVVVRLDYDGTVAGFSALGEKGTPAEEVAETAAAAARSFDDGSGVVDDHLADQLVLPVALAGGRVELPRATDHAETNTSLVREFGFDVRLERGNGSATLVAPGR